MKLNENELDAITEVINIGVGQAANALSEITGSRIELTIPNVHICTPNDLNEMLNSKDLDLDITVKQGFGGALAGKAMLTFVNNEAFDLARIVGGIQSTDGNIDEELRGILEEIGNIVLNSILGSISNLFKCGLSYTLPTLCTMRNILFPNNDEGIDSDSLVLHADTSFKIADCNIQGALLVLFETSDIKDLLSALTVIETV